MRTSCSSQNLGLAFLFFFAGLEVIEKKVPRRLRRARQRRLGDLARARRSPSASCSHARRRRRVVVAARHRACDDGARNARADPLRCGPDGGSLGQGGARNGGGGRVLADRRSSRSSSPARYGAGTRDRAARLVRRGRGRRCRGGARVPRPPRDRQGASGETINDERAKPPVQALAAACSPRSSCSRATPASTSSSVPSRPGLIAGIALDWSRGRDRQRSGSRESGSGS